LRLSPARWKSIGEQRKPLAIFPQLQIGREKKESEEDRHMKTTLEECDPVRGHRHRADHEGKQKEHNIDISQTKLQGYVQQQGHHHESGYGQPNAGKR
jgi:hypothetical protein